MCSAPALFMSRRRCSEKRGSENDSGRRERSLKSTAIQPQVRHNVHIISGQDNVIWATCGAVRDGAVALLPWSRRPSIHFVRLRHTNLPVSL